MTIKTASLRDLNKLPKYSYKILITRYYPFYIKDIKRIIDEWIPDLAPTKELLKAFKDELKRTNNQEIAFNISKYDSRFRHQVLNDSVSMNELRRIGRLSKEKDVYLLCHEKEETYCHRRIVREIIEMGIGAGWI